MNDRLGLLADPAVRGALSRELGWPIEHHAAIPSTQERGRALADAGTSRALVVADEQSAGHGRHGRAWQAPRGSSLLASWVFRPLVADPASFALLAGVAVARALASLGVADAQVKWPNDVQLRGHKVAGVLADAVTAEDGGALVLGIGVNVRQTREQLTELRDIATSLAAEGLAVDRLALLARLCIELERIASSATERRAALEEWRARSATLGREVEVRPPTGAPLRGIARAVADDGALVVDTASGPRHVLAGEVSLVR
ncbi:MAG: biotin--[acetyl-CoA-carboxylase] ligase [Chloroflexota bacterium]|nr:biotin--[acetyl-CoA-carboxylase] ligase [Chloroflexota bacterium]